MTDLSDALNRIEAAAKSGGLPALAKAADVPYSTAAELRGKGWRTRAIATIEKLSAAADAMLDADAASQDAAA
jgi:hypothetical protein